MSCQHDSDRQCACDKGLTGHEDIDTFLNECLETMRAKGHDYREGHDDDLLHNFRTVGEDMDIAPEKVWYIYASKHWKAIKTFIKEGGQSESEPIEGRIKDVIVYLLLLYRRVQEMKANTVVEEIMRAEEEVDLAPAESPKVSVAPGIDLDPERMKRNIAREDLEPGPVVLREGKVSIPVGEVVVPPIGEVEVDAKVMQVRAGLRAPTGSNGEADHG